MLNASTLAALHQICTNVHLSVDVQELSTLLTVLGVLPHSPHKAPARCSASRCGCSPPAAREA